MDTYSIILLLAMLAVAVACTGAVWIWVRGLNPRIARTAQVAGVMGIFLALFSLIAHYELGHRQGIAAAMELSEYLRAHPAALVTILIGAVSSWLANTKKEKPDLGE